MKLSVLEHSHISEGRTVAETLAETTRLAVEAEKLGYARFWVSEHHNTGALASSSPEVLIAHVAAHTSRIRVGSGGVMLPHYSAYKVAENFRLLEALHPGRIDLGLGRAPGGMPIATRALQEGKYTDVRQYPQQIADLAGYLHDALPPDHRFAGLVANPVIDTAPEVWLLGSSGETAKIAAEQGAAYAFAHFFGTPGGEAAIRHYREHFKPSVLNDGRPHTMIAVSVVCADTEEEAQRLAKSGELFFLQIGRGALPDTFPSVETAERYPYSEFERAHIAQRQRDLVVVVGAPEQVREKLRTLRERYDADELMIASMIHDFDARLRSFRLTAEACLDA